MRGPHGGEGKGPGWWKSKMGKRGGGICPLRPPFLDRRLERCPPRDLVTPADYSDASLSASDVRPVSLGCGRLLPRPRAFCERCYPERFTAA